MKAGGPLKLKAIGVETDMFMYCSTYIINIFQDKTYKFLKGKWNQLCFPN